MLSQDPKGNNNETSKQGGSHGNFELWQNFTCSLNFFSVGGSVFELLSTSAIT